MKKIVILSMLALALVSCANRNAKKNNSSEERQPMEQVRPEGHTSQNALDYAGTYKGVIPCADCPGIEVTIVLDYNGNYTKKMIYQGNKRNNIFNSKGTYEWNGIGTKITLTGESEPEMYLVGENRLFMLDKDGNRIAGTLSDNYILEKIQ